MKKRILSFLLVVAMLAAMVVMPAYAADVNAADYNNTPDTCPCCGLAWSEITWTDFNSVVAGGSTGQQTGSYNVTAAGHYQLTGDLTSGAKVDAMVRFRLSEAGKVVFDLNGYTIAQTGATSSYNNAWVFYLQSTRNDCTLNIVDTQGGGAVKTNSYTVPMIYFEKANATHSLNIYGGTYEITQNPTSNDGAIINAKCPVNIYGGVFDASNVSTAKRGGAFYTERATLIKDAYIVGGTATGGGNALYANNTTLTIRGNTTIIGGIQNNGGNIDVKETVTLTELDLTVGKTAIRDCTALAEGAEITVKAATGVPFTAAFADADEAAHYANYFNADPYAIKWTEDTFQLYVSDEAKKETCPHCNEDVVWQDWTLAAGSTLSEGGHYRLTGSQSISNRYYIGEANAGIEVCLDMAGYDIVSTSGIYNNFWIETGNTLAIIDTTNGSSTITAKTNNNGGAFYVKGVLEIDGVDISSAANSPGSGTSTQKGGLVYCSDTANVEIKNSTLTPSSNRTVGYGGAIAVNSATVEMTNCIINGGKVYHNGAAIDVVAGSITLNDCTVNGGDAVEHGGTICVYGAGTLTINGGSLSNGTAVYGAGIYLGESASFNISDTAAGVIGMYVHSVLFQGYGEAILNTSCETLAMTITLDSHYNAPVYAKDGALYVSAGTATAKDGAYTWHATAADAVAAYDAGNADYIVACGQDIALANNAVIDVNGCEAVKLTSTENATINCFDSANEDYKTFGYVTLGDAVQVKDSYVNANGTTYITVEENGQYSFHALDMEIVAVSLKTKTGGLYYEAVWYCDDTLKGQIDTFGIAANLGDIPTKLIEDQYSWRYGTELVSGVPFVGATINGIIGNDEVKDENGEVLTNDVRGKVKLYAAPYVLLENSDEPIISTIEVGVSLYDCCVLIDKMINEKLAADPDDADAANYIDYMNNYLFTDKVVAAEGKAGWASLVPGWEGEFDNFFNATTTEETT